MTDSLGPNRPVGYLLPYLLLGTRELKPIFFMENPIISGDSKTAQFAPNSVLGASEETFSYTGSFARQLSLTLYYTAVSGKYDHRWVAQQVSRLRALVYPVYSRRRPFTDNFAPPPRVLLNYGHKYVNLPCIVTNVSVSEDNDVYREKDTMLPLRTAVTLSLTISYPYGLAPGHDDIAAQFVGSSQYTSSNDPRSWLDVINQDDTDFVGNYIIGNESATLEFEDSSNNDIRWHLNSQFMLNDNIIDIVNTSAGMQSLSPINSSDVLDKIIFGEFNNQVSTSIPESITNIGDNDILAQEANQEAFNHLEREIERERIASVTTDTIAAGFTE